MEKMGNVGGEGKKKTRLPTGLVVLQNTYTRWTGPLIGVVGCKLIDVCQSEVVFLLADSVTFDDTLIEGLLFLSELAMSRVTSRHFFSCSWK